MGEERAAGGQANGRAPGTAAPLSGIVPGLGQAWLGAPRRGLLIALPIVATFSALAVAILGDPVGVLDAVDQAEIANLAVLAARVDSHDIQAISLAPPTYPEYIRTVDMERIQKAVAGVFDTSEASPSPTPDSTPSPCPRT